MPEIIFAPEKSKVFQKAASAVNYYNLILALARAIIWVLGVVAGLLWLFSSFGLIDITSRVEGLFILLISLALGVLGYHLYLNWYIRDINLPFPLVSIFQQSQKINLSDFLDFEAALILQKASKGAISQEKLPSLNEILKYLIKNQRIGYILVRGGIRGSDLVASASEAGSQPQIPEKLIKILESAAKFAIAEKDSDIALGALFYGIVSQTAELQKVLFNVGLKIEDLANIIFWEKNLKDTIEAQKSAWRRLEKGGGIGRGWAYGYTPNLLQFAFDITKVIEEKGLTIHLYGKKNEISELETVLARSNKNNVLLVGEPGVGKNTVVLGFAEKVLKGETLQPLRYKRLLQLDIGKLLAGAGPGEVEARMQMALNEAVKAGNIILFIDEIENLLGGQVGKVGSVDASGILIPYLGSPQFQIIATTTHDGFHRYIESNSQVAENLERVEVSEPKENQVIRILEDVTPFIETKNQVVFSYQALKRIVELAKRYIHNVPFPEKAIDVLDEAAVYVSSKTQDKLVSPAHIEEIITQKTRVPVGELEVSEKSKLLQLEDFLHQRVVDQEEAIQAIADAMRRARAGLGEGKKPIGSFLFLGPTGVGKTETSKALAESYFGSEKRMIRLDMSEYNTIEGVNILTGEQGLLTRNVRDNPFSLVLLDEIEKAAPEVLNLLLQVLDEGHLTDQSGRMTDFTNSIIIATSNAGAELIRESIKAGMAEGVLKDKLLDYLQRKNIFKPEFLNRFDGVISFKPLTAEEIFQICQMEFGRLTNKLKKEKEIDFSISDEAVRKLAQLGTDPVMGARPLKRVIADKVENLLAKKMLSGELKRGGSIKIQISDIS